MVWLLRAVLMASTTKVAQETCRGLGPPEGGPGNWTADLRRWSSSCRRAHH
jgi:hypothetical protein